MSFITPAASVLLCGGPDHSQVFLVQRGQHLRFFGGFWAFPGGKVATEDAQIPLHTRDPELGLPPEIHPYVVTAVRELFEETGVLVARDEKGKSHPFLPNLDLVRREMLAGRLDFARALRELRLSLWADDFRLVGKITTPAFVPLRFATTFLVTRLPPGQQAVVWPGELTTGRWASPAAKLEAWTRGQCLVSPPTVMVLQAIEGDGPLAAPQQLGPLWGRLEAGAIHPIFFAPRVQLIPMRTPALPPTTHTNAYLVGHDPAYLFDPGPNDPDEQQRLFELLDERCSAGMKLAGIVLTHHHPDHIGAVQACKERYRVPVLAHPLTARSLQDKVAVDAWLTDGDRLELGTRPDGSGLWHLAALHTPGHAAGHLAFWDPYYRLLFAGDMVSTLTSVAIVPPEGDLRQYLASLRRLLEYPARLLLPAHGGASSQPQQTILECLEHRARREQQLLAALGPRPRRIAELTRELYRGLPNELLALAERQVLAALLKLQQEGRAEQVGQGWQAQKSGSKPA